jgi:hypothetical protein
MREVRQARRRRVCPLTAGVGDDGSPLCVQTETDGLHESHEHVRIDQLWFKTLERAFWFKTLERVLV